MIASWGLMLLAAALLVWGSITWWRRREKARQLSANMLLLQTELEQFEAERESMPNEQEAYRQFIYNISHEVANPLQSIQTNLDNMIECTQEETGRWQQYHGIISVEIRRLSQMTANLRLLARLETTGAAVKREPINIKAVIEDVLMAQIERAEQRGIRLVYNGPNRPARVFGNRDHLRQVLLNLVDNGIKYAKESGGEIVLSASDTSERLVVKISDNGIGIPAEDLPFVFDTAYRAPNSKSLRRAGTGLGLAIVRRIVEQHGGEIQVESELATGTVFTFDLPVYHPD